MTTELEPAGCELDDWRQRPSPITSFTLISVRLNQNVIEGEAVDVTEQKALPE
jgi:hypothetical protein